MHKQVKRIIRPPHLANMNYLAITTESDRGPFTIDTFLSKYGEHANSTQLVDRNTGFVSRKAWHQGEANKISLDYKALTN